MSSLLKRSTAEDQFVVPGPHITGHRISCNAAQRCILVGNRLFHLTPSEYRVALHLLFQREQGERGQAPLWTSYTALSEATGILDQALLNKHLYNASNKLAPAGIEFVRTRTAQHGDIYQTVLFGRDVRRGKAHE